MPARLEQAVAELREEGDLAVYAVILDYNGWGGHPIDEDHAAMAEQLTAAIQAELGE